MTLPEGRKPLLWSDMEFAKPVKANQFNCLSGHPSTWEGEAKALREQNTELALQVLASDGQAADAHEARLIAEDQAKALRRDYALMKTDRNNLRSLLDQAEANVDELHDKLETAEDQTKALQARVAKLEAVLGKLVLCEDAEFYHGAIESGSPYCIDFDEWHREARAALQEGEGDEG